jgi:hypothetical protein
MTHPETAIAGLFDHEQDQPGPHTRGRERPAPDWGGDELFSSTPRRRRRLDPEQARRAAADRHRLRDVGEHHLQVVTQHDDWSSLRPDEDRSATLGPSVTLEPEPPAETVPVAIEAAAASVQAVEFAEIAPPAGRRTVTITGNPDARTVRPRRPAPTVDQRIGHRPDRIAGWAFALGMLLILIAILTANAG